jgi:Domain of unknown function (DUF4326)
MTDGFKPRVLNKHIDGQPKDAVYIGRPSKFGNKFEIGKDGTRKEVIEKYKEWLTKQPVLLAQIKKELKGKDLVCFCSPRPCTATSF